MSTLPIAYLVTPSYVTNTGILRGTIVCCYKVLVDQHAISCNAIPRSTGIMYKLTPDGTLEEKPTNATLEHKYLNWRYKGIQTELPAVTHYFGCTLFSTPELAIAYKLKQIQASYRDANAHIARSVANLAKTTDQCKHHQGFFAQYPELLI